MFSVGKVNILQPSGSSYGINSTELSKNNDPKVNDEDHFRHRVGRGEDLQPPGQYEAGSISPQSLEQSLPSQPPFRDQSPQAYHQSNNQEPRSISSTPTLGVETGGSTISPGPSSQPLRRRHNSEEGAVPDLRNQTWPMPTNSPHSRKALSRQWAWEGAGFGGPEFEQSLEEEQNPKPRSRIGSSRSAELHTPPANDWMEGYYRQSSQVDKGSGRGGTRSAKKVPGSARRSSKTPGKGTGKKKKKSGTGKKKKKKGGRGRRKKSRSQSKGARRRANSQPPKVSASEEMLGMLEGSAFFASHRNSGSNSVMSGMSMSRDELRRHLSGHGTQGPRMQTSRSRSPSFARSFGVSQGNFAPHTFGGADALSHRSFTGHSMENSSNTSSITWSHRSRGRRSSMSVVTFGHQSRSLSPKKNTVHTKYFKHDPEKRRNVMKFGSAEKAWEPMYNSMVHKNPIPTASNAWSKHIKKQDKKEWDLETLDTIGTRAYSPVHLLRSKPPSYKHVRSKMWWAENGTNSKQNLNRARSGSQGSFRESIQNKPRATDWAMFSPRSVRSNR